MGDPLTIIGGVAAVLQISSTVVSLIKSVKGATHDRQRLLAEINATAALLGTLKDYAEIDAVSWTKTFHTLCESNNGPIQRFEAELHRLQKKLAPQGMSNTKHDGHLPIVHNLHGKPWLQFLKWPFEKDEIREIITSIERQKSLLNIALTNDSLRLTAAIHGEIGSIAKGVDSIRLNQENEERKQILSGLSSIDFEAIHCDISSRRVKYTGQWLLESTEFETWVRAKNAPILWCRGIPGAGKTVMTSLVIDHLRSLRATNASIGVAGLYCTYKDRSTITNLFGSVLRQLVESLYVLPSSIFKDHRDQSLSSKEIYEELSIVTSSYEQVFLVIDALDECVNKLDLLGEIHRLLGAAVGMFTLLS